MDIKLKDFEGPLDLLLHLVSKYQMDIYEVPLVEVIEQYLAYVNGLQALRLEVAGEYMVMASQLMLIKSRRLLPKLVEEVPIEDDPELDLLRQLEEYKLYKELSHELAEQHQKRALHFSKSKEELVYEDITLNHDKTTLDLFLAFSKVMAARQQTLKNSQTTIERDDYKIEDMMVRVKDRLTTGRRMRLDDLFAETSSVSELITLFLATLELIKIKDIEVEQEENFGDIHLTLVHEGGNHVLPS